MKPSVNNGQIIYIKLVYTKGMQYESHKDIIIILEYNSYLLILAGFISDECDRQKHCNGIVVLSG
jgi:hypothetical protein